MELVLRAEISALETRLRLRTVDYRTASRLMTGILDQMASLNRGFAGYLLSMVRERGEFCAWCCRGSA